MSFTPPPVLAGTLSLPTDLNRWLNVSSLHLNSINGEGTKSVVVDSGCFRHPFFTSNELVPPNVVLGFGADSAELDNYGHGTAMCANLLSVAPKTDLTVVKAHTDRYFEGLEQAISLDPDVISCSWGYNFQMWQIGADELKYQNLIDEAIGNGITILFAAGNAQSWNFPAQVPNVIAVGGLAVNGNRIVNSGFTSNFTSRAYDGRKVPDICGLSGPAPNGGLIVCPVPPDSELDHKGATDGDGTTTGDGWAVFGGSSSATAQVAGVCLLIKHRLKQKGVKWATSTLKQLLQTTASASTDGTPLDVGLINAAKCVEQIG